MNDFHFSHNIDNKIQYGIARELINGEPAIRFNGGQNTVDAAIAVTDTGFLGKATPADGYGTPKSETTAAVVNAAVEKYGRTSKLTKGTITAINATVKVGYSKGTALFVNQIVVYGNKPFIKAGDSGSLLVTDPGLNPVGLLFAGSSSGKYAIANQIEVVLDELGVSLSSRPWPERRRNAGDDDRSGS